MTMEKFRMKWWGWGDEGTRFDTQKRPGIFVYLKKYFGMTQWKEDPGWDWQRIEIPETRLPKGPLQEFRDLLGERCRTDKKDRILHTYGKGYKDLIRIRAYEIALAPDLIVYPQNETEVQAILTLCQKHRIALIPFGGGTTVVGGVEPTKGHCEFICSIDLLYMNRLLALDETSLLATFEAGIFGPPLEETLKAKGYVLGHFPQSFEYSTLGGWIASRSSGQNSLGYGGIEEMVVALRVVTPKGVIETVKVPNKAEGPDVKEILVGSEGTLGIIVSATVKIHPFPKARDYFMLVFPSFTKAIEASRLLAQAKLNLSMIRVSDEEESEMMFAVQRHKRFTKVESAVAKILFKCLGFRYESLSLVLIGLEGEAQDLEMTRLTLQRILAGFKYFNAGRAPGRSWLKDRFFLPYLRDEFLNNELFLETLETATTWKNLEVLYREVRLAIQGVCEKENLPHRVYAHVSHLYPDGASLYFTILVKQRTQNPVQQWEDIKLAANQAIRRNGGVISHHHGIGLDHKAFLYAAHSPEYLLMQGLKESLDPQKILNPEKII